MSGVSPLISVVIPCYNTASYLTQAIRSALNQTYSHIEILVVDDGSTDNTASIVAQFSDSAVINYVYQSNKGLSAARNKGITMARGEYIALLDADDLWEPEKLEKQIGLFKQYPFCRMVFTDYSTFNAQGVLSETRNADRHDGSVSYEQLLSRFNFIYPSTVVIRREVFEHCGYFDENLRSIEDYDMWLRIARQFEIRGIREPLVRIRIHDSNMSRNIPLMLDYENRVINKHRANLSWPAHRRRLAKNCFLNSDRYIHQQQRIRSMRLFFKGLFLYPFLFTDMTIVTLKFILGRHCAEQIRVHALNSNSLLGKFYWTLFKRY